ncbi:MAG: zinc transport system permease protein [Lentimonas sp.]|jgi:zinc transport system permease protein
MPESSSINAILAAIGIALATAPIGVFILWKKMAYFGDAISHSSLFGLAIATIAAILPIYGILACALVFCLLIFLLEKQNLYSSDSIIGIVACVLLSSGMILLTFFPSEIDLEDYLFGDLRNLSNSQVLIIYFVAILVLVAIFMWFKKLLLTTINKDLARISGIKVKKLELQFLLLTALMVASLVKIVGIFLITSIILMPAAIACNFAKTPSQMMFLAIFFSLICAIGGLFFATIFAIPASPAIITFSSALLIASIIGTKNAR